MKSSRTMTILLCVLALALTVSAGSAARAENFDLPGVPWNYLPVPPPPPGSSWHELYPAFCVMHEQEEYDDNGDGVISPCDGFNTVNPDGSLSGWHVTWVGPTYVLVPAAGGDPGYYEPVDADPYNPENPVCQTWVEVYPDHGLLEHVDGWDDNGDGIVSPCDMVMVGGIWYHIEYIGTNIEVEPGPVSSEKRTWGQVKDQY